jgi:teichuronic acid biosynthesis glycosyltransferase TuaC
MSQVESVVPQTLDVTPASDAAGATAPIHAQLESAIRVLAVIPGTGKDASFMFLRRQLQSLKRVGVEVREIYLHSRTSPLYLFRTRKLLAKEISDFRPDVIHSQYGTVTSLLCCTVSSAPLVITFRGSDLNRHLSVTWLRGQLSILFSQVSALRASQIICVSRQLLDRLWWGRHKSTVLPTGVNLDMFSQTSVAEARAALNWDPTERIVLFCGGTEPGAKGLNLVQAAVRCAEKAVGSIRLFVLDGSFPSETVPLYLNAADCLAFASLNEGSPNIVKEALACNLPIVSVDVGDVRERLEGVSPSQIVHRDSREFGVALADILQTRKRSNGREKVREFSEDATAFRLLSLYRGALRRDHTLSGTTEKASRFP